MVVWEALDALSHQFELCRIDASTRVVMLDDGLTEASHLALIRAAVARTGAEAMTVTPARSDAQAVERLANQALLPALLDAADIVVASLVEPGDELAALLDDARCQVLYLRPGDTNPQTYPPHASLRHRTNALEAAIESSSVLQITDELGTDLRVNLGAGAIDSDHGLVGDDVSEATFPAGWVEVTPAAGSVRGDVVIMPGDSNVSAARVVSSPLRLRIQSDHISAIEGENADADLLRAQLEYPGEPNAYGAASLAVGMNPGSVPFVTFDDRLVDRQLCRLAAGMITLAFGHNLVADRPCGQTISLALPGRSLTLDGLPVLGGGVLQGDFAPDVYEL